MSLLRDRSEKRKIQIKPLMRNEGRINPIPYLMRLLKAVYV